MCTPPWQWGTFGGLPVSGKGSTNSPQAPLPAKRLSMTVSLRPRLIVIPVPSGEVPAVPLGGASAWLLSCTSLCTKVQHDVSEPGHAPFCGDGASSLFSLLVSTPSWLWSNSELSISSFPPEFVPE